MHGQGGLHSQHGSMHSSGGGMLGGVQGGRPVMPSLHMQGQVQQQEVVTNQAVLQAVNGVWQELQQVRAMMETMRREMNQMRSDVLRQTGQLTELDG